MEDAASSLQVPIEQLRASESRRAAVLTLRTLAQDVALCLLFAQETGCVRGNSRGSAASKRATHPRTVICSPSCSQCVSTCGPLSECALLVGLLVECEPELPSIWIALRSQLQLSITLSCAEIDVGHSA